MAKNKLKTKHFFPFVRMVRAMGGRKLIATIESALKDSKGKGGSEGKITDEAALGLIGTLIELLPNAEDETMDFLALFMEKSREEVEEQPIDETVNAIVDLFKDTKFMDFLNSASKASPGDSTTSS